MAAPTTAGASDLTRTVARRARWTPAFLLAGWVSLVVAGTVLAFFASSLVVMPGDLQLARGIQRVGLTDPAVGPLMYAVSLVGAPPWVVLLYVAAVAAFAAVRRWAATILMALTATADAMAGAVKLVVGRARPTEDLVRIQNTASDFSFPSGHVVHYVVFFGALAYLCVRTVRRRDSSLPTRLAAAAALVLSVGLIALVGLSRIYLGAHWPSDTLGGYLLGGAWLAMLIAAHRKWVEPRWLPTRRAVLAASAAAVPEPLRTARAA